MAVSLNLNPRKMLRNLEVNWIFVLVWVTCASIRATEVEPTIGDPSEQERIRCSGWCFCDPFSAIVSCSGDGRVTFPTADLTLSAAERVEIRNFAIHRWQAQLLHNSSQLRELGVVRCQLVDVANNSFSDNARLERLDLSQNFLTVVTQSMFTGLARLKSLDLSSNKLIQIDEAFIQLSALEQLDLRDNALTVLGPYSLKGLYRLQFLNVDGNNLSVIAESALQELTSVAHLILSHNPLTGLVHLDLFAARITYLDLSLAQLTTVPGLMARYVRDFRLQGNKFDVLRKGDFESLVHVRLLVLDDNSITGVEEDTFGRMDKLEKLYLNDNLLEEIPQSLPAASLKHLYLSGNRIRSLRSFDLSGLSHLEQLHLARNCINSVQLGTFADLQALTTLDLHKNNITKVTRDMFFGLENLQFLDLSENPIIQADVLAFVHSPKLISPKLINQNVSLQDAVQKLGNASATASLNLTSSVASVTTTFRPESVTEMRTGPFVPTRRTSWPRNLAAFRSATTETSYFINLSATRSGLSDEKSLPPSRRKPPKMKETAVTTTTKTPITSEKAISVPKPTNQLTPPVNWASIILWWFAICAVVLSGLFAIVSLLNCLSKKQIYKSKPSFAVWRRSTVPDSRPKDSVKLGWFDEADQWGATVVASHEAPESEHERLILAIK